MGRLERFSQGGKIGYKNDAGDVIVQPQYDEGPYSFGKYEAIGHYNEYCAVALNGKFGVLHQSGNLVVPCEYMEATPLFDDLFALKRPVNGRDFVVGVMNAQGEIIIPFEYNEISSSGEFIQCFKEPSPEVSSSAFWVKGDEFWFNNVGNLVLQGPALCGKKQYLIAISNAKLGVVDKEGHVILECKYDSIDCIDNDCFVVRINDGSDWNCAVVDKCGEIVIPFDYKFIKQNHPNFIECYAQGDCESKYEKSQIYKYEYSALGDSNWFTSQGQFIHKGSGRVLNDDLLAVEKDGHWGVYNINLKRVVNFNYDHINYQQGKILVAKDGCVGVLDTDGSIVINPSYKSIECVNISGDTCKDFHGREFYCSYSDKNIFSTADSNSNLAKVDIYIGRHPVLHRKGIYASFSWRLDFSKIFILRSSDYEELFSIEEGIFANSRFDQISQLTDISYAVRKGDLWGVYRRDVKELIVPCEYEQIVFEGGHVVHLKKGGLWGAKGLVLPSHIFFNGLNVAIPERFLEIKTLTHPFETLFGVRVMDKNYKGEEYERYTIIDKNANEVGKVKEFRNITSQFSYYRDDRILCSIKDKYGFVSLDGFVTIPFKYDEVCEGKNGLFHIRIGNSWGLLSLDKGEIVPVKYLDGVPVDFEDWIVTDAMTGRCGMLAGNGTEKIPAIYDHIQPNDDLIYFGYGGYDDDENSSFFSQICGATWGCLNSEGQLIIPAKYHCFKICGEYILAGRDGYMLREGDSTYARDYSGVYDLYTKAGELLIGGFSQFEYVEGQKLFKFFFGGSWKHTKELIDEWNDIYDYSYHFEKGAGKWVVTDLELKSIKLKSGGEPYSFGKGKIVTIRTEKQDNKVTNYWNCPIDILFDTCPDAVGGYLIYTKSNEMCAIRLLDGKESLSYDQIEYVDTNRFFVRIGDEVGLVDFDGNRILPVKYVALTRPVGSYMFAVTALEDNFSRVDLIDLGNGEIKEYCAVSKRELSEVLSSMAYGLYLIYPNPSAVGLKSISVYRKSEFDDDFQNQINDNEDGKFLKKYSLRYWFSNHWDLRPHEVYSGRDDYDDTDYARDTWDAMTDGMYGDMPDGFDGDYSFMGRD